MLMGWCAEDPLLILKGQIDWKIMYVLISYLKKVVILLRYHFSSPRLFLNLGTWTSNIWQNRRSILQTCGSMTRCNENVEESMGSSHTHNQAPCEPQPVHGLCWIQRIASYVAHTNRLYSQTINLNSDTKPQEFSSWITVLVNKYQIG